MRSHHLCTPVSIFLNVLLVSGLVLACLPKAEANSKNHGSSVKPAKTSQRPKLSSPEECARTCSAGEPPKICYYHFFLEHYTVLGAACQSCTPNATNPLQENCQCVLADGVERGILTVNRMIPGPSIEVCKGDKIVVDVENNMMGMEVTIHWHGIFQKGYQYYDGVPFVTQCPISEGNTFRYQFRANNAGTHYWHSHTGMQRTDGVQGMLIVREPKCKDRNRNLYDKDLSRHAIMFSDWLHDDATSRFPGRLRTDPGQEPESILINGKGQYTNRSDGSTTDTPLQIFTLKSGHRYRFRMINAFSMTCSAQLIIQGHGLTVIATDGIAVRPVNVNSINSFAGERYDFVLNANQTPSAYWIQVRALGQCSGDQVQQLAILHYEGGPDKPSDKPPTYDNGLDQGVVLNPFDSVCDTPSKDEICINHLEHAEPINKRMSKLQPDKKITLPFSFRTPEFGELFKPKTYQKFLVTGGGRHVISYIDNFSFKFPPSPILSQPNDVPPETLCNKDKKPANCQENCTCTHHIDIKKNDIVEIILVDESVTGAQLSHPFHLHGHAFNVVAMGRSPDKNITHMTLDHVRDLDRRGLIKRNLKLLPFKDTIPVPSHGYVIIRFDANNCGEWLFHCHFQYHTAVGMDLLLHVGDTKDLPPVPAGFPTCGSYVPKIVPFKNAGSVHSH